MLADEGDGTAFAGALASTLHLPGTSIDAIIGFIGDLLPTWRDDPTRPAAKQETKLTAQLCARLNSACRHSSYDFLQFRQEEPDTVAGGRTVDLAVAPAGAVLIIAGKSYSEYQTILPVECKRLPIPAVADRDPREYVFSAFSTTGGVDRFKRGHHGAGHTRAAMIGYIQDKNTQHWKAQLDAWVSALAAAGIGNWTAADELNLLKHDTIERAAHLNSVHTRAMSLAPIALDHLWVEFEA